MTEKRKPHNKGGRVGVWLRGGLDLTGCPVFPLPWERRAVSSQPGSRPEQQALLHQWHADGDLITKPGKRGWSLTAWKAAKFQSPRREWC